MINIVRPDNRPMSTEGRTSLPSMMLPHYRRMQAEERGVLDSFMVLTPEAIGDCVCTIPVVRFACEQFEGMRVSVATRYPELFEHLDCTIYHLPKEEPEWEKHFSVRAYYMNDELTEEFTSNFGTQIVDYCCTCAFANQVPIAYKVIDLPQYDLVDARDVLVHPGRSWPSKTFSKNWWNQVLKEMRTRGIRPTLVGAGSREEERGTVDVDATGCEDLRGEWSMKQAISGLQKAKVLVTNDSAPMHIAAAGSAHIGFLSTIKHPDNVTHWRINGNGQPQFGWRMENLSKGWLWSPRHMDPRQNSGDRFDQVDPQVLRSWLPDPEEVAIWTSNKLA